METIKTKDITIERTFQGLRLSIVYANRLISHHFIGYNKRESIQIFKDLLRNGVI